MRTKRRPARSAPASPPPPLVTGVAAVGAAGCGGNKTQQTSKQAATQRWNRPGRACCSRWPRDQYNSGNFDKCRKTLDDALKLDPENPQVHLLSAKLSIEQGQLELAERELDLVREHAAERRRGRTTSAA